MVSVVLVPRVAAVEALARLVWPQAVGGVEARDAPAAGQGVLRVRGEVEVRVASAAEVEQDEPGAGVEDEPGVEPGGPGVAA
jgi:hypothetical protein